MEPVGLGIGIAGLAGIFSTCLDMIERIDSYRDFRVDSRAIISQFDADILLFKQWGKSVGYDGKTLEDDHHENLNDAETFSAIRKIFEIIQDIAEDLTEGSSSQQDGAESTISRGKLNDSRRRQFQKLRGFASHRTKIEWILRHKARFLALSQQFGSLVGSLRALVPPETSRSVDSVGGQLHQADPSSHNDVMSKPIRGVNASSPHLDFQRLCMEIEKQFERHMKKDLDDWLGASFTNATYSDSVEKRLPDTCNWILDRGVFVDWESANFASTRAKVLWINGPAGYGKTVLSARIVQHLKARDNLILAHFFFSADLENRADPFIVIRSWASQIISQNREAFDIACGKLEVQNGQPASSTEVMGLFKEIVQQVPNCICVVDALDECSSKGNWSTVQSNTMESFIRLTMQAISGTSSQVLMVSRDDQEIRKGLAQSNTKNAGFEVFEYKIDPADVKPDASKLACSIVDEKLHKKSTALKAEIAERIVDRCDSMFLRIKLLENDIRSGKNQKQLERIVDQAPAALGDLYDRNWARIMGRSNDQDRALAILRWITFGLRPITVFEMTEALLLTGFEDVDDFENELPDEVDESYIQTEILELCESLVETRAGNSTDVLGLKTLHLTHFTVRQYVLLHLPTNASQLIANGNLTSSNELFQHNILAEACLRYLSISSLWNKEQCKEATSELKGSFRSYAMDSWNKHAKNEGCNYSVVSELIVSFFCSANDSWEAWRQHFDTTQAQSRMLQYNGDITLASKIFYATLLGLQEVFETWVKDAEIDINYTDESGRTAMLAAAHEGRLDLLKSLIQYNADVNKASTEGRTPLYVASRNGHIGILELLVAKGADLTITNNFGWTPLNSAADSGHIEIVKLLLEKGADMAIADNDGWTPLHNAADNGHIKVVKLLLEKGADLDIASKRGWTPLNSAASNGHIEVVKLLLEKGADLAIANNGGWTPLNTAADNGHIEVVKLLLEKGADLAIVNNNRWTPLNSAASNGHIEVVKLLLEKGADLVIASKKGWTPLNSAASNGHIEVVKLLLEKGADLAIADNDGWTPLNSAADGGHIEVVKLLLERGADLAIDNNDGWTPLNNAASNGHIEVVKLLLGKEADDSAATNYGWTPPHKSASKGHLDVVKLLLQEDAYVSAATNKGWTTVHLAAQKGHE